MSRDQVEKRANNNCEIAQPEGSKVKDMSARSSEGPTNPKHKGSSLLPVFEMTSC